MIRTLRTLAACTLLAFGASEPALALDSQQKKEMGAFIREYLLQNPEVLLEVQDALQAKKQAQRVQQSKKAIAENQKLIFSSTDDISLGNPKGDVTVVEFFDYNCGYCKQALSDMDEILSKDKNVRFVLKEFPILGPDSVAAHRVANAVRLLAPTKYPEFHRKLLGGESHASEDIAIEVAKDLGLEEHAIRTSMASSPNDDIISRTYELASELGITGTPTYIVGDEAVFGAAGTAEITAKIANVRSCGKASC